MTSKILHGTKPTFPLEESTAGQYLCNSLKHFRNIENCMTNDKTGETISYNRLLEITCGLAETFSKHGYTTETVIAICSENSFYFMVPLMAAFYSGLTVTPVSNFSTERELLHAFNISKPSVIFCSRQTVVLIVKIRSQLEFIKKIVVLDGASPLSETEPLEHFIWNWNDPSRVNVDQYKPCVFNSNERVALILLSSGSTGLPKGVMLTHRNLMALFNSYKDPSVEYLKNLNLGDATINVLPLYHVFGLMTTLLSLASGYHTVIVEKFKDYEYLCTIEKHKVKAAFAVTPIVIALSKSDHIGKYNISSLTDVVCASALLTKDTITAIQIRLKLKELRQGYGLTETTFAVLFTPPGNQNLNSIGKALPFISAKIIDIDSQTSLGPNQRGEICLKGDLVMKGYYANPDANRNALDENGWLHTGDIGYFDEEGYFYFVERIKEMIKFKAFQVAPAELEALLLEDPRIRDAAVVGFPDPVAGELPTAFVVLHSEAVLSKEDIQDFVNRQVSPEKRLRGGVRFINSIPRNPTGKISRKELKELLFLQQS